MATTSNRALTLLSILGAGSTIGCDELAARFGVSARTIRRDIDTLRELGYEVHSAPGAGGGYRLGSGTRLPPMVFDEDQVVAIAVALQTVPTVLTGMTEACARALRTVRQVMPERMRIDSDAFTVTSIPNYWEFPAAPIDASIVREVGAAVRRRHVLRADYLQDDAISRVRVEPHDIVVWAARWYLLAYDLDEHRWRALRLERLVAKPATFLPFEPREVPAESAEAFVKASFDRGDSLAPWPCQGSAVLPVPPELVAEFAPGGAIVERLDAATSRLRMGAWSWQGLAGLYLTFAIELTDVEPSDLRQAFARIRDSLPVD